MLYNISKGLNTNQNVTSRLLNSQADQDLLAHLEQTHRNNFWGKWLQGKDPLPNRGEELDLADIGSSEEYHEDIWSGLRRPSASGKDSEEYTEEEPLTDDWEDEDDDDNSGG